MHEGGYHEVCCSRGNYLPQVSTRPASKPTAQQRELRALETLQWIRAVFVCMLRYLRLSFHYDRWSWCRYLSSGSEELLCMALLRSEKRCALRSRRLM